MELATPMARRTISLSIESQGYSTITARTREITKAISNRNPSSLLSMTFRRSSCTPPHPVEEKSDSSVQLVLLKKTIDQQKLSGGKGDNAISLLKQELKQLELEATKRDFWHKQNTLKIKQLQQSIESALNRQLEETTNQEIYNHLLKRMKKTKIFLELRSAALNESLESNEHILSNEKKKQLLTQESVIQAINTFKDFKKNIISETDEGTSQIEVLQKSLEKNKVLSVRRENWKKHQETMYEAAVIEDRSVKNVKIKESLSIHRLWYNVLNQIFQRKKEKSKRLEEAFQNIKIVTGIPEISQVVENFLTKEQTYEALMDTVNKKERECSAYKKKIDKIQLRVSNFSNKEVSDADTLNKMKQLEQEKTKELLDLSNKRFLLENTHAKLKTWIKLMIKKFNKIIGKDSPELSNEENLGFYIQEIKKVCSYGIKNSSSNLSLGQIIEDNRKRAVNSMIKSLSKTPHSVFRQESINKSELVGVDSDT